MLILPGQQCSFSEVWSTLFHIITIIIITELLWLFGVFDFISRHSIFVLVGSSPTDAIIVDENLRISLLVGMGKV